MIFHEPKSRIWLHAKPMDMRKSYQGLKAVVRNEMNSNVLDGDYFVFVNRKKTQLKMLYFDRTGYCLWGKQLEQGQFPCQSGDKAKQELSWTEFKLLLEGIKIEKARYSNRWKYSQES